MGHVLPADKLISIHTMYYLSNKDKFIIIKVIKFPTRKTFSYFVNPLGVPTSKAIFQ